MWQEKVLIDGPYHFDLALSRMAMDPLHIIDRKERWVKVPIYGERSEVATVQAVGTIEKPAFMITGNNEATKARVLERISTIFQWETDLAYIHTHFTSTTLQPIFDIHRGTPIVLDFAPYTTLIKAIIHQQVNMTFAISLTETFVKTFGTQIDGVPFYPEPDVMAALQPEQLREMKFSQRKAEYIIGLAELLATGELKLEELEKLSDEVVIKRLTKVRGIGPWTAQSFLMFGLGRANLFPTADIGIQNALKNVYGLDRKPTIEEMKQYIVDWNPYLSYASLYLWRSIEPTE